MSSVKPTLSGTLQSTPLSHLLVYSLDRRLEGTIVLERPSREKSAIQLVEGAPCKVKTSEPVVYLSDLLVEHGLLDAPSRQRTLEEARRTKQLHGLVLRRAGLIESDSLRDALREQASRQIEWLFGLEPATAFGYYAGADFLARYGGADTPRGRPLAILWNAIRNRAEAARVQGTCQKLTGHVLRLHADAPVRRFRFDRHEQAVVEVLQAKPQSLGELLARDLAPADLVEKLVYVLAITRSFQLAGSGEYDPVGMDEVPSSTRSLVPERPPSGTTPSISAGAFSTASTPRPGGASGRSGTPVRMSVSPARADATPEPGQTAAESARTTPPPTSHNSDVRPTATPAPTSGAPRTPAPTSGAPRTPAPTSGAPRSSSSSGHRRADSSGSVDSFVATGDPEIDGFKKEILEQARAKGQSYYDVLGVPPKAQEAQVQAAFFKLAKKWHPDRLGEQFEDIRAAATKVFSRMSEAHQVLSDPERRKEYDSVLSTGGGAADEQEKIAGVLRAASAFQRAEVALKRGRLEEAERELRSAVEDDPEQEEYQGTLAWIEANKADALELDEYIKTLTRAINKDQNNPRLRWYRGQLYKKAGNIARAVYDFRQILEVNPHHVEAAREVRLYEMRRSSNRPTTGLGKWFRR